MTQEFLETIWRSTGYGELRSIRNDEKGVHRVEQSYYQTGDEYDYSALLAESRARNSEGYDIYFGVVPRLRMGGTAQACPHHVGVLWADIDAKKHDDSKLKALGALGGVHPAPHVIVDSGGGYHAYWLLQEPIGIGEAARVMVAIADQVKGDHVQDVSRVLRLPGTINHKYGRPARLIKLDNSVARYQFSTLQDAFLPIELATYVHDGVVWPLQDRYQPGPLNIRSAKTPWERLPAWLVELLMSNPPKGTRSEAVYKAILWLFRYGWTEQEIFTLLSGCALGVKMQEKSIAEGRRWFDRTAKRARRAADAHD